MTSTTRVLPSSATVAVNHIWAMRSSLADRAAMYAATAATIATIASNHTSMRRRRLGPSGPLDVVMTPSLRSPRPAASSAVAPTVATSTAPTATVERRPRVVRRAGVGGGGGHPAGG